MCRLPTLLIAAMMTTWPAMATEAPACASASAGATACLAGKLCVCGFVRGGSISGRPDGWRWECGALRPSCGEAAPTMSVPPVPFPQLYLQLPSGGPRLR